MYCESDDSYNFELIDQFRDGTSQSIDVLLSKCSYPAFLNRQIVEQLDHSGGKRHLVLPP